ncbi:MULTISPECIES: transcriptional regulator [Bacilli]|nr:MULTISPECIES: transcriptional regulator [Bacilli]MBF1827841.1 transcriptional regulator [Escherichia coli]MDV8116421.1 transcriptional regulator [Bacillus sp. BAU-SS-2023]MCT6909732.1 transcriptional regulator [Bacillus cereus]MCX2467368.1 transcriptional regulator [Bacillus sp. AM01]NKW77697.1 transcriptional regulator [Bacillus cereus]
MLVLMIMLPISLVPVCYFFGYYGFIALLVLSILLMFASLKVESIKREHNLKTYREIVDFVEGKPVNKVKVDKKNRVLKTSLILLIPLISYIVVYLGMTAFGV